MKRTCDGCKAFSEAHSGRCELGYKTTLKDIHKSFFDWKPAEECPKPLTNKQLLSTARKEG